MTIIAMTHEIGTCGSKIALRLAQSFGIELADQSFLTQRVADLWLNDHRSCHYSDAQSIDRSGDEQSGVAQTDTVRRLPFGVDERRLAKIAEEEITELAAYGNVLIRGWGAPSLLRDNIHVVRVRICAETAFRRRILAARFPALDETEIMAMIERSDACLESNLEPVLGRQWRTGDFYHLTIAAETMSLPDAVHRIGTFIKSARALQLHNPCRHA